MNNIIIGIVALIIVVGGWFAFSNQDKTETVVQEESAVLQEGGGSYESYSADKVARAATGSVVLFFRAGWCPTCRGVDADIRANLRSIPIDFTILDIDYDTSTTLKQRYGITYQHTFVQVDAAGTLLKKWQGSPTLAALVAEVEQQ